MDDFFVAVSGSVERLRVAVEEKFSCGAEFLAVMPIAVVARRFSWEGAVTAFDLQGHAFAQRCYAWRTENDRSHCVLKHYPITSAEEAVRSWLQTTSRQAGVSSTLRARGDSNTKPSDP